MAWTVYLVALVHNLVFHNSGSVCSLSLLPLLLLLLLLLLHCLHFVLYYCYYSYCYYGCSHLSGCYCHQIMMICSISTVYSFHLTESWRANINGINHNCPHFFFLHEHKNVYSCKECNCTYLMSYYYCR